MEKFAVDLDKVLDDFEFNEDRAEQLANVPARKPHEVPPHQHRPAAAPPYRRPHFEPINMAEADYSAAPEGTYRSRWQERTAPPGPRNDEESTSEDDESDDDVEPARRLDMPKNNVDEGVGFYANNSFRDEFLELRGSSDEADVQKWTDKAPVFVDNNSGGRVKMVGGFLNPNDSENSGGRVKMVGGFLNPNDSVNSCGLSSKVGVKDVKTVSNDLAFNKIKNLDKNVTADDGRNLPDVASTSERPAFQIVNNVPDNTFDLVTNLRNNEQSYGKGAKLEAEKFPHVSSNETSEEELEPEPLPTSAVVPLPLPSVDNGVTSQIADSNANVEVTTDNRAIATQGIKSTGDADCSETPKHVELKSLFSFTEMDHLSDADLLTYLQEIEDEENASIPNSETSVPDPMTRIPEMKPRITDPVVIAPDPIVVPVPAVTLPDPVTRIPDPKPYFPDPVVITPKPVRVTPPAVRVPVPEKRLTSRSENRPATVNLDELIPVVDLERHAIFERQVEFIPEQNPSLKAPPRERPNFEDFTEAVVESTKDAAREPSEVRAISEIRCVRDSSGDTGVVSNENENAVSVSPRIVSQTPVAPVEDQSRVSVKSAVLKLPSTSAVVAESHSTTSDALSNILQNVAKCTASTVDAVHQRETVACSEIGDYVTKSAINLNVTGDTIGENASSTTSATGDNIPTTSSTVGQRAGLPESMFSRLVPLEKVSVDPWNTSGAATSPKEPAEAVAVARRNISGASVVPKGPVFEMSLPECQRQSETEDSSPEDEESMEDGTFVGISAETGAAIELRQDAERPGYAVDEVRSPMIQSPRDGAAIHVLGEEERPTRPKYLLLAGVAAGDDADGGGQPRPANVGPPGSTPSASSTNHNARILELDNRRPTGALDNRLNDNYETSTTVDVAGVDDVNMNFDVGEAVDNAVEDNAANDNVVNEQDADAAYAESLVPDPSSRECLTPEERSLGKLPPFWIPDQEAATCMSCDVRFTVLKRRHHCRACGKVLCSKCCALKFRLEYMDNAEGRVCEPCYHILLKVLLEEQGECAGDSPSNPRHASTAPLGRRPNPNNPMEYCSTIPPLMQQEASGGGNPPSVLVPVLKREGSARPKGEAAKQVMFSDGIRPGGDLTELDGSSEPRLPFRRPGRVAKRVSTPPGGAPGSALSAPSRTALPVLDTKTLSYIRQDGGLPPIATVTKGDLTLDDSSSHEQLMAAMRIDTEPPVTFAINRNLFVKVKILNLSCCVNRTCWCFATDGLGSVGQDEVMFVLETTDNETTLPTDVFTFINQLYQDAVRGSSVSEMGCTLLSSPFLGSSTHGAFLYVRPSFQCLDRLIIPAAPYLVVLLVHRCEVPWARVFPIRLMLRLGAESRYYPCSLVSTRHRKPVYREIGHTIMNLLADFRNLTYTLPAVRGLVIHMEDKQTSILLPRNRYDQVTRAINNSNENVLALAANLSLVADSHLVCVQSEEDSSYHTQAINIHSKPRRVTGASYVVFNGALKTSSNLTAKSSIVEDGLMVQILPDTMLALRAALRNMKDFKIGCGPVGAATPDETVEVKWVDDDAHFNVGVRSVIDGRSLDGVPSIRVHNGTDYMGRTRLVRWTEVFILQSEESGSRTQDPVDVGRLSESIARATCQAVVKLLDLLAQAGYVRLAVRATIHPENVGYEAGSRGEKLPPLYMDSLDNELVPVLHTAAAANEHADAILELVFHVLRQ